VVDVDLDGDLDIVLGTAGVELAEADVTRFTNRLYLNTGAGSFEASVSIGSDRQITNTLKVGDIDGDGRPDVIVGNEDRDAENIALPATNRVHRNIGLPSGIAPAPQLSAYATSTRVDAETSPIVSVSLDASFDPL